MTFGPGHNPLQRLIQMFQGLAELLHLLMKTRGKLIEAQQLTTWTLNGIDLEQLLNGQRVVMATGRTGYGY